MDLLKRARRRTASTALGLCKCRVFWSLLWLYPVDHSFQQRV